MGRKGVVWRGKPRRCQYETVEERGRVAALEGKGRQACPYRDRRMDNNRVTFSRAFQNAWFRGWEKGREERLEGIA